jgi:hypothetical protein
LARARTASRTGESVNGLGAVTRKKRSKPGRVVQLVGLGEVGLARAGQRHGLRGIEGQMNGHDPTAVDRQHRAVAASPAV